MYQVLARTELDGVTKGKADEDLLMRLYALNEVDAKLTNGLAPPAGLILYTALPPVRSHPTRGLHTLHHIAPTVCPPSPGIDWRQKLDSQRGAVLATELKNNSNKLAKWTLQVYLWVYL